MILGDNFFRTFRLLIPGRKPRQRVQWFSVGQAFSLTPHTLSNRCDSLSPRAPGFPRKRQPASAPNCNEPSTQNDLQSVAFRCLKMRRSVSANSVRSCRPHAVGWRPAPTTPPPPPQNMRHYAALCGTRHASTTTLANRRVGVTHRCVTVCGRSRPRDGSGRRHLLGTVAGGFGL